MAREIIRGAATANWLAINYAIAGTSVSSLVGTRVLTYGVTIKAAPGNAGTVYVSNAANQVVGEGYPLAAGEEVYIPVDQLGKVKLIASQAAQIVNYIAY